MYIGVHTSFCSGGHRPLCPDKYSTVQKQWYMITWWEGRGNDIKWEGNYHLPLNWQKTQDSVGIVFILGFSDRIFFIFKIFLKFLFLKSLSSNFVPLWFHPVLHLNFLPNVLKTSRKSASPVFEDESWMKAGIEPGECPTRLAEA